MCGGCKSIILDEFSSDKQTNDNTTPKFQISIEMADDEATEKESIISNLDLEIHINGSNTSKVSSQKSKRKLTLFAIGMIFLVLIISIPMATKPSSKMYANNETCLTAECKKAAKLILSSMDESIDPCTDFYKYGLDQFVILSAYSF